jgi:hypothetical protein
MSSKTYQPVVKPTESSGREPIHAQPRLCRGILGRVQTQAELEIKESTIPRAGSGLFSASEIHAGEEIFRTGPLVNCRTPSVKDTCDQCFASSKATVHAEGRFITADDRNLPIKSCSGCRIARYCSHVSCSD